MATEEPGPSYGAWVEEGRMLRRRKEAATWDLGDWLVKGEGWKFDTGFKKSRQITGYSRSYLHALHTVAKAWPIYDRNPMKTWALHKLLLREPDDMTRRELLARAVKENWNSGHVERYFAENPPPSEYGKHKERNSPRDRHVLVKCPGCSLEFPMSSHKLPRLELVKKKKAS